MRRTVIALLLAAGLTGCAASRLAGYAVAPDYPGFDGEARLAGLAAPVTVTFREDGVAKIEAQNERDATLAMGYLQARDRLFEMDFIRHMALGRLAELLGDVPMAGKTAVETDLFNRAMGFGADAEALYAAMPAEDRELIDAFAAGVNAWIAEDHPSLEHRLLGVSVAPWRPQDSLAIFRIVMFGLTHNYSRELRRLTVACAAGFEALERVWPTRIDFDAYFLPPEAYAPPAHPIPAAVAPEMRAELAGLCPRTPAAPRDAPPAPGELQGGGAEMVYNPLTVWLHGAEASNNWIVSGARTATGKPILANDPHMPHMNPPIVWPVEIVIPGMHGAGFTLVGVHGIFVGHNGRVAWGSTINNVDLQDLYVLKPHGHGYALDGTEAAFTVVREVFRVKDGPAVEKTYRVSRFGPLLNDIDTTAAAWIPLTALRRTEIRDAGDAPAMRRVLYARNVTELVATLQGFDSACINWVGADVDGNIGWTSPCRVPRRPTHLGTFPAPGWTAAYDWQGYYPKAALPRVVNPAQGYLATANNEPMPRGSFPTSYQNDASPPNRWQRIDAALAASDRHTVESAAALQTDVGLAYWPRVRQGLAPAVCEGAPLADAAARAAALLCGWDGALTPDAAAATLFIYFNHAVADRAVADELPGGAAGELWSYLQTVPHIETNLERLWYEPVTAAVWDDARTPAVEDRTAIFRAAFEDAVRETVRRHGDDASGWRWGEARPFVLKHFFGGKGGVLGRVFNADPLPGRGAPETVNKNQFIRADREAMQVVAGPSLRFIADLGDLSKSRFALAGGASGWPRSPFYANLLPEWNEGATRPLTPEGGRAAGVLRLRP